MPALTVTIHSERTFTSGPTVFTGTVACSGSDGETLPHVFLQLHKTFAASGGNATLSLEALSGTPALVSSPVTITPGDWGGEGGASTLVHIATGMEPGDVVAFTYTHGGTESPGLHRMEVQAIAKESASTSSRLASVASSVGTLSLASWALPPAFLGRTIVDDPTPSGDGDASKVFGTLRTFTLPGPSEAPAFVDVTLSTDSTARTLASVFVGFVTASGFPYFGAVPVRGFHGMRLLGDGVFDTLSAGGAGVVLGLAPCTVRFHIPWSSAGYVPSGLVVALDGGRAAAVTVESVDVLATNGSLDPTVVSNRAGAEYVRWTTSGTQIDVATTVDPEEAVAGSRFRMTVRTSSTLARPVQVLTVEADAELTPTPLVVSFPTAEGGRRSTRVPSATNSVVLPPLVAGTPPAHEVVIQGIAGAPRVSGTDHKVYLRLTGPTITDARTVELDLPVVASPLPPRAALTVSPSPADARETVTIDGSISTPGSPEDPIETYIFDFGDGSKVTQTSPVATHQYLRAGEYTVSLSVVSQDRFRSAASTQLKVTKLLPDPPDPSPEGSAVPRPTYVPVDEDFPALQVRRPTRID